MDDAFAEGQRHEPPLIPLEAELAALLALQSSARLTTGTRGYICDALLLATVHGWNWPTSPPTGDDGAGLAALRDLTARWTALAIAAPISQRYRLGQVGRLLQTAVNCEQDPDALDRRLRRDLLERDPQLAAPPPPYVLPNGRVL